MEYKEKHRQIEVKKDSKKIVCSTRKYRDLASSLEDRTVRRLELRKQRGKRRKAAAEKNELRKKHKKI